MLCVCVALLPPCAVLCARLDTSIALQVEKFHADAEERRKEKETARIRREAAQAARCVGGGVGGTRWTLLSVYSVFAWLCGQLFSWAKSQANTEYTQQLGTKPGKHRIVTPLCCTCMRVHYGSHGLWHPAAPHAVGGTCD